MARQETRTQGFLANEATSAQIVETNESGIPDYAAGIDGVVEVPAECRLVSVCCIAGASVATLTINGGDLVVIPANTPFHWEPRGNWIAPTLVFSATDSYFVEWVE